MIVLWQNHPQNQHKIIWFLIQSREPSTEPALNNYTESREPSIHRIRTSFVGLHESPTLPQKELQKNHPCTEAEHACHLTAAFLVDFFFLAWFCLSPSCAPCFVVFFFFFVVASFSCSCHWYSRSLSGSVWHNKLSIWQRSQVLNKSARNGSLTSNQS